MANYVTRTRLALRIRQRCKMEGSTYFTEQELFDLIGETVASLYDKLVEARGQEYYRRTQALATVPGQRLYVLPDDHYKTIAVVMNRALVSSPTAGVFYFDDSQVKVTGWRQLAPYMMGELSQLLNSTGNPTHYRLRGQQKAPDIAAAELIELLPAPESIETLRLDYIPICNRTQDDDGEITWDGINGWEKWVVLSVCMELLDSQESDTSGIERQLAKEEARIQALADSRDSGRSERVADVTGSLGVPELWGIPTRPKDW